MTRQPLKQTEASAEDRKMRYGGLLENPYISRIHRNCLDGFKVSGLKRILEKLELGTVLDIGCGLGEYSALSPQSYCGFDNSFERVRFAQRLYPESTFLHADARFPPFQDKSFDSVMLANTAHHLSDEALIGVIESMRRIARKYIIIDDCVLTHNQSWLSRFFYRLDRGTMFRHSGELISIFNACGLNQILIQDEHITFPALYTHAVFVLDNEVAGYEPVFH